MSGYRIVFNEQTEKFRIQRRGLSGWNFIMDRSGRDYASFDTYERARRYASRVERFSADAAPTACVFRAAPTQCHLTSRALSTSTARFVRRLR